MGAGTKSSCGGLRENLNIALAVESAGIAAVAVAAKRIDDGRSEVVKTFDPTAEETLFIPRLQGG
jgi:hypothetical protein